MVLVARRFSITNFAIATTALGFQVFVLYPWHQELDADFKKLQQEVIQLRKSGVEERSTVEDRWKEMKSIMEKVDARLSPAAK